MNSRALAVRCLGEVVHGRRSLSDALPATLAGIDDGRTRSFVQELSYGVLRWYPRLEKLAVELLRKPLRRKDRDIHLLILTGLYQLACLQVSDHAAINETVDGARDLEKPWAAGLVNGVLRNFQRQRSSLERLADEDDEVRLAHPSWLLQRFRKDWPEDWQVLARANNERPPMTLRVNLRVNSRSDYRELLGTSGIDARDVAHTSSGLTLSQPLPVEQLPGFFDGRVSVQDGAAQLAAELLSPGPGMQVLDACAAPGGKTAHLLETSDGLATLTAIDIDAVRLARVADNLARLGMEARLLAGDAGTPDAWWDGDPYQCILLDAPCSATGVIRRHPDIKILRREDDIATLVRRQAELLDALWPLLARRGMLLYVTCSVLRQENDEQVSRFVNAHADCREQPIEAGWGRAVAVGRQILPGEEGMDGFYYACLVKQ